LDVSPGFAVTLRLGNDSIPSAMAFAVFVEQYFGSFAPCHGAKVKI
jgi:hypothetical protein